MKNKFLTLIKGVTKKVSLEVRSSNEQAKNFYNKMGFKESKYDAYVAYCFANRCVHRFQQRGA